ncbi:ribonuclease domain-containing protein [Nocardioides carbamazepini]|uniref:ribonuclease domain-containing protein n=1 Tax=Nocardioides carbamazepini TaxID=2854259 RepID=UPI002149CE3B|nr:ribonuclease domain-containing protein [Nocardioides carbamazepini]
MPRLSRRTTQVVSTVVTVVLLVGVWWLQSRGADDPASSRTTDPASAASSPTATHEQMPEADEDGVPYVALRTLPREAAETVELIAAGGPFPYPGKDGSTFGNLEGLLPDRARGYYAEYTVGTPGLDHRGARRIIAGDGGELYWTADHYESFERIWESG